MTEMEVIYANLQEAMDQIGRLEDAGRDVSTTLLNYVEELKKAYEEIKKNERT